MGKKKEENLPPEADETASAAEEAIEEETNNGEAQEVDAELAGEEVDYQAEALQNKELYLRALADLENYRKRAAREKQDAIRFANSNLLREMIPVIDNLERAVEHACEDGDKGLLEGVQMTLEQFRKVLEGFGVKVIESLGQMFDPEFHQAMGEMVTGDVDPGCVAQEMQKAYTLNDRLLRPALVMVAKAPEPEPEADEADNSEESEDPDADSGTDASDE